jgi:hypothetical protein
VKDTAARKTFLVFPLLPVFPFSKKNYSNILSLNLGGKIELFIEKGIGKN